MKKITFLLFVLCICLLNACGQPAAPQSPGSSPTVRVPSSTTGTAVQAATATWALPPDRIDTHQVILVDINSNLQILDLQESTMHVLERDCEAAFLYLSPDGSKVIYTTAVDNDSYPWQHFLLDLENGRRIQLEGPVSQTIWDPHGDFFIAEIQTNDILIPAIVSAVDGRIISPLDQFPIGWDFDISNAGQLLFNDVVTGMDSIKALDIRFGGEGQFLGLTEDLDRVLQPFEPSDEVVITTLAISPDSEHIAFVLATVNQSSRMPGDLYVINLDSTGLVNLTGGRFIQEHRAIVGLNWSPDGSRIAFVSDSIEGAYDYQVHVVETDGSGIFDITGGDFPNGHNPSWSPDGRQLLYVTWGTNYFGQYGVLTNPDGTIQNLLPGVSNVLTAAFRPALSLSATPVNCAARFTRLEIGMQAIVTEGDRNRVRSEPAQGNNLITSIPAGTVMDIIDGPVCANGLAFWLVESIAIPGGVGWTAEGDFSEYWLEPYNP